MDKLSKKAQLRVYGVLSNIEFAVLAVGLFFGSMVMYCLMANEVALAFKIAVSTIIAVTLINKALDALSDRLIK